MELDKLKSEMESFLFHKLSQEYFQNRDFLDIADREDIIEQKFKPEITAILKDKFFLLLTTEEHFMENSLNEIIDQYSKTTVKERNIEEQIYALKRRPQPAQRTPEWYSFRYNLITASDAYKIFKSQASQNEIIVKKCQPLEKLDIKEEENEEAETKTKKIKLIQPIKKSVNVYTSLHWGQKYEPLSVMLYEEKFKTKIGDFGCMQHPVYPFIGASPDGINVLRSSPLFGRMLEIKNVVSREITGIPKNEYWIQMQIQMEVCDLDECDFLETKFVEYENVDEFNADEDDTVVKGKFIWFQLPDQTPLYHFCPLDKTSEADILEWEENALKMPYLFISFIYWKLDVFSCMLIKRDKEWFRSHVDEIGNIWKIIEKERVTGKYILRKPKPRAPRQPNKKKHIFDQDNLPLNTCFLSIKKKN